MHQYNKLAPQFFSRNGEEFYGLFDVKTERLLNISATEDGLRWTTNKFGKLVYYKNAKLKITEDFVYIVPNDNSKELVKSNAVYAVRMRYSGQAL